MREQDEFDRLLDSALRTYGEPEPGLEGRVLSSIAETRTLRGARSPLRRWLYWMIAIPVAACLLLVFSLRKSPPSGGGAQLPAHPPVETATNHSAQSEPRLIPRNVPGPTSRRPALHAQLRVGRGLAKSAALPKLDIFPSPQPLSPEEKALCAFATQVPEKQRQAILDAQKNVDAPLNVATLRIQPLKISDTGKN